MKPIITGALRATTGALRGPRALAGAAVLMAGGLAAAGCASAGAAGLTSTTGTAGTPVTTVATGSSGPGACPSGSPSLSVAGQATVNGTPDEVTLDLAVQTQASSATQAMASNASITSTLVARLKKQGVPAAQLQTSNYSVQPVYNNNGTVIRGYQVVNAVTVTLYDIHRAGPVIDTAGAVAGNAIQVSGVNFSLRSETKLLGEAREAAVRQAAQQAALMAGGAGERRGPLCSLTDESSQQEVAPQPLTGFAASSKAAQTPVAAGTLQVTATVAAVYELLG